MKLIRVELVLGCLLAAQSAWAQVQTFRNDYPGFLNAAGAVSTIDFETLPDGSQSQAGTAITNTFNYDAFGSHFSVPLGTLHIAGNTTTGFELSAFTSISGPHTWVIADMTAPARAVGVFYPSVTTLCAFSSSGAALGCVSYNAPVAGPFFVGIVSNVPIARVTADANSFSETITSFVFAPVPEPATAALLIVGVLCVVRRRKV